MPETKFLKCTCAGCGGHIEFPADGIGMTIPCPHCATETELTLEVPESTSPLSSRSLKWALAGVVILVIGVIGVFAALNVAKKVLKKPRSTTLARSALRPRKTEVPSAAATAAMVHTNNFISSGVKIEQKPGSTLTYAIGNLKNQSDGPRFGVTVVLDLFDAAGTRVGTAKDYRDSMEARADWKFRALLVKENVASVHVISIREQP